MEFKVSFSRLDEQQVGLIRALLIGRGAIEVEVGEWCFRQVCENWSWDHLWVDLLRDLAAVPEIATIHATGAGSQRSLLFTLSFRAPNF